MMTPKGAKNAVTRMSMMRFFPADPAVHALLMEDLGGICESDEQADWLARRALDLCPEWPGVQTIWQIYFSKFPPRNERQRALDKGCGVTSQFPEGVPSESPTPPPAQFLLPPANSPARKILASVVRSVKSLPAAKTGGA